MPNVWIMKTKTGFYPIEPSDKCKPEDHGRLNDHVMMIEDTDGNVLWDREHDAWFRGKVEEALNSTKPSKHHVEVMDEVRSGLK